MVREVYLRGKYYTPVDHIWPTFRCYGMDLRVIGNYYGLYSLNIYANLFYAPVTILM